MKILLLSILAFAPTLSFAVSTVEIGELQFHKIDQLASTKSIDDGFVSHLREIQMSASANAGEYIVTFLQEADAGKTPATVSIVATHDGTAKSFAEAKSAPASRFIDWAGKAPMDLLEKAVEYVSDTATDARLIPFQNGFTGAVISPEQSANGLVGIVTVRAGAQDGRLVIRVGLNGTILSVEKQ